MNKSKRECNKKKKTQAPITFYAMGVRINMLSVDYYDFFLLTTGFVSVEK